MIEKRFNDLGAHQFASPNRRISAGTSKPLMSVASRMIAKATPKPIIFTNVTPLVIKEAKTIASRTAAAEMIRAER